MVQTHVQGVGEGRLWGQAVATVTRTFFSAYSAKGDRTVVAENDMGGNHSAFVTLHLHPPCQCD